MIDINLIPAALRKNGKEISSLTINIPGEILVGVGAGLLVLIVTVHLILGVVWLIGIGQLTAHQAAWQKLASDKAALDAINDESKDIKNKMNMISGLTTKQSVLWAPKFNAISDALPRGLWIRNMTLDKTGLSMEGSVVSKTGNEINNVGLFISTLKQNEDFMKGFSSVEVISIQRSRTNSIEVADFTVMAKLNETGSK
jgi:Tfp pilus assembly protein PilN